MVKWHRGGSVKREELYGMGSLGKMVPWGKNSDKS